MGQVSRTNRGDFATMKRTFIRTAVTAITAVVAAMLVAPPSAGAATGPVRADYHGQVIDLADGWQNAQACTEFSNGTVKCYDTDAEARRDLPAAPAGTIGTRASSDCAYRWVCLWQDAAYTGRILRWSAPGTKNLGDWNFRDKASSACNNKAIGGAELDDLRTGLPDPMMFVGVGSCVKDFSKVDYPYGGSWNDKADKLSI
jgi:hypothetical protein